MQEVDAALPKPTQQKIGAVVRGRTRELERSMATKRRKPEAVEKPKMKATTLYLAAGAFKQVRRLACDKDITAQDFYREAVRAALAKRGIVMADFDAMPTKRSRSRRDPAI